MSMLGIQVVYNFVFHFYKFVVSLSKAIALSVRLELPTTWHECLDTL